MVTFEERERELGLRKFAESKRGTLFLADWSHSVTIDRMFVKPLVRKLDGFITPDLKNTYVAMVKAADEWVAQHPDVDRLVRLLPVTEVGEDYIARHHMSYEYSTLSYDDEDDSISIPKEPPELAELRTAFKEAQGKLTDTKSKIIERVLARSILEPSGVTVFDEDDATFTIVEPEIHEQDLKDFAAAS